MKIPPLTVNVEVGAQMPRGYGFAWRHYAREGAVAMPIPLNLIVGWLRRTYEDFTWRLASPGTKVQQLRRAYLQGRDVELKECAARIGRDRKQRS